MNDQTKRIEGTAEPCVSTREAAKTIGCHRNTLLRMAAEGRVPAIRIGKVFRFQLSKVMAALSL